MFARSFFLQNLVVSLLGLTLFAVLASMAWNTIGDEQFNQGLFDRSSSLAELLLPPASSSTQQQAESVNRIAERLDFEMTLFDPMGQLIAASAEPAPWVTPSVEPGSWQPMDRQRSWLTVLKDHRVLVIRLNRVGLPNETFAVVLTFGLLAIVISCLLYPLSRRVSHRLERLQREVEKIGPDNLAARVTVEGQDEIAKLASSFNRSTQTIEELITSQRLLLANTSHELRTPLARIRLGVELLETRNTPVRRQELFDDIRELDDLIDDLITMVRYDVDVKRDTWALVDLLEIAQSETLRYPNCTVSGESTPVSGDRRMLKHLLRNLLDNASVHGQPPLSVEASCDELGSFVVVRDGGPGIAINDRERVLEPFLRGSGKQNESGYGLGLPIAVRIARLHSATLVIEDSPQSAVFVRFPAVD